MEPVIEIKDISKRFNKQHVLSHVNLRLEKNGACIAIVGPNGCGKTTLIKCILGMVLPTAGCILYHGENINKNFHYKNHIGYMPQIGRYPENMTIAQVLKIIKNIRPTIKEYDEELIAQLGLNKLSESKMRTLSGGTTQKVSAAIAFLFNPDVLILDEPTAGLDLLSSEILRNKINSEKQKKNGKLTIITSHLLSELDDLVTEIIFMQEGQIIFHKNVEWLKKETGNTKLSKAIINFIKK